MPKLPKTDKSNPEFIEPNKVADQDQPDKPDQGASALEQPGKEPKASAAKNGDSGNKFKQLIRSYLSHKKLTIPLTILVLIGLLIAIPFTRYALAGTVVKNDVTI